MARVIYSSDGVPIFPHKARFYARTGNVEAIRLISGCGISPIEFIFDAIQFGQTAIVKETLREGFTLDDKAVEEEIDALSYVFDSEKPVTDLSLVSAFLKCETNVDPKLIDNLCRSMTKQFDVNDSNDEHDQQDGESSIFDQIRHDRQSLRQKGLRHWI